MKIITSTDIKESKEKALSKRIFEFVVDYINHDIIETFDGEKATLCDGHTSFKYLAGILPGPLLESLRKNYLSDDILSNMKKDLFRLIEEAGWNTHLRPDDVPGQGNMVILTPKNK